MSAPSPTAAPSRAGTRRPAPSDSAEARRVAVWLLRFIGALGLVWLTVWWVVPPHSFSGPVIWVIDGKDGHGLHLGDLPAVLFLVAAAWLVLPVRRGRPPTHGADDALRVAAVGALAGLALYWIVPEHTWSGRVILHLRGRNHGVHLLDPLVVFPLALAIYLARRWLQPILAGVLFVFAVWWAKGSHVSFSGPVIAHIGDRHVIQRGDLLAVVPLGLSAALGVPWVRDRWARFQRERAEHRAVDAGGPATE
jgi:hypothetical protein